MVQNAEVAGFTISKLLRENQYGGGKIKKEKQHKIFTSVMRKM